MYKQHRNFFLKKKSDKHLENMNEESLAEFPIYSREQNAELNR